LSWRLSFPLSLTHLEGSQLLCWTALCSGLQPRAGEDLRASCEHGVAPPGEELWSNCSWGWYLHCFVSHTWRDARFWVRN
jgi:hypothetical protein